VREIDRLGGYTVKQVAKLSGVSVRALHHYDEIGLLKPDSVGANGYRYYGRDELLRLQQILFHRELGFPLDQIRQVLDAPGFDRVAALKAQRARLEAETKRHRELLKTIDTTLAELEGERQMDETAMYKGFDPRKQAEHEAWLTERFGDKVKPAIESSRARFQGMTPAQVAQTMADAEAIEADFAGALKAGLPPDSDAVLGITRRHAAWVGASWNAAPTAERYKGLGQLFLDHPEFRARYEGRAPGLTEYLAAAMRAYADRELA
jgi:DNA-binding transcriptional MerR regulator